MIPHSLLQLKQDLLACDINFWPTEYSTTGSHYRADVEPHKIIDFAHIMARHDFFLETVTAVDRLKEDIIEGLYLFNRYLESARIMAKTKIDRNSPRLQSIGGIFPGAVWHERETSEFFGVIYDGCPDSRKLLLPEDADYHPLRKDFEATS
jgi:NADH-quinone oxidoreductase subunit C